MNVTIEEEPYAQTTFYSGYIEIKDKPYDITIIKSFDLNTDWVNVDISFPDEVPPNECEVAKKIMKQLDN